MPFSLTLCPRCNSDQFRRSHIRNIWERSLSLLILPCRCISCERRFFRPRWMLRSVATSKKTLQTR